MTKYENLIIGGGIAGLWLSAFLSSHGRQNLVVTDGALGQTHWSQGIIHGGAKYGLFVRDNKIQSGLIESVAMWENAFRGIGPVNLSNACILSDAHFLLSKNILVKHLLFPVLKRKFGLQQQKVIDGTFLNESVSTLGLLEKVVDVSSVLAVLSQQADIHEATVISLDVNARQAILADQTVISAEKIFVLAGGGSERIMESSGISVPMQRRPLAMLKVYGDDLPKIFGHYIGLSSKPLITVTSPGGYWYIGGEISERGVNLSDNECFEQATRILNEVFPAYNFKQRPYEVVRLDRAEGRCARGSRPSEPSIVQVTNDVVVAWPTKLTLSPILAQRLFRLY